mmetsp:Transcript_9597/g.26084  ORF Transcript_9597/g.26084 Transcript_9597/m.26084 type:complete len:215 (+) Transcript_9597:137-781(+)
MFRISAQLKLSVSLTTASQSMSPCFERGAEWMRRTSWRACWFGSGISILRSSLPGLSSAGSSTSGRFVAMMIFTLPRVSKPSIWFSSSMSVRWISRSAEVPWEKRLQPMASISSMKMMQGSWSRAKANISRIILELSPMYLSTTDEATTLMKFTVMQWAMARASKVLPVPGGPYKSTPFGALMPTRKKSSGLVSGSSTTSRISLICSVKPPTSW